MSTEEVTKSKDPKLVASRVFIGNLPSERTSREELEEKFTPYGKILGISIHQGFAFVQYDEERPAQAAVEAEQGCYFKGKKLDLRIASEGRKERPNRGPPMKRPHEEFMPRRPEYEDPGFHGRMQPPPWEREGFGPDHMLDRERGPEAFRDEPFWRERFGHPHPPPAVGPPPPMDAFHRGDSFGGPPPPPSKRVEYGVERPFDSVIVAVNKHLKMYAEMVERKLIELNMTVDVIFLVHENALLKAIDDMTRRGVLYILIVQPQHEERKSITVNIMHGTPQEHRNMPLDDALAMLARNFKTYLSSLRSGSEQPSMGFLLNLLSDGKHLSVAELDRIIAHLQDRRDRMIEAEGGKVVARDIAPAASNSTAEQLQQRILSILGGGGSSGGGPNVSAAPAANPASMLATMAQHFGLNLNPTSAAGVLPPSSSIASLPGKDVTSSLKPATTPGSGGIVDPNLSKNLDALLQNPALLKTLVPQASAIQAGNRTVAPPGSASPYGGPDNKSNLFSGAMGGQQKPSGGPPGEAEMAGRPPQPPPMPGARGVPGPGY